MYQKLYTPLAVARRKFGNFHFQISITSTASAGSSTLLDLLRSKFANSKVKFVSGGEIFRKLAKDNGYDDVSVYAKMLEDSGDTEPDYWLDRQIEDYGRQDVVVLEARLPHVLMPNAFKVYLDCPVQVRAHRRHLQLSRAGENITYTQVIRNILHRDFCDHERNSKRYPGYDWGRSYYDLVIHTDALTSIQAMACLLDSHSGWVSKK